VIEATSDDDASAATLHQRSNQSKQGARNVMRHASVAAASLVFGAFGWTSSRPSNADIATRLVATTSPDAPRLISAFVGGHYADDSQALAAWVAVTANNAGMHYLIVDKRHAVVHAFAPNGTLLASSAVLLGAAAGDSVVPGIGERAVADVMPHERITPAGRFMGERGRNTRGERIVWIDYDAGISMHRVRTNNIAEDRLKRLTTLDAKDNRISFGCINLPDAFFDQVVEPMFAKERALVYVLPEVKTIEEVFGS
jgi:hypothetical protein